MFRRRVWTFSKKSDARGSGSSKKTGVSECETRVFVDGYAGFAGAMEGFAGVYFCFCAFFRHCSAAVLSASNPPSSAFFASLSSAGTM